MGPPGSSDGKETWVQTLGPEDALKKGMATHSSTLTWKISWTEEPGGLQPTGLKRVRHDWATNTFALTFKGDAQVTQWYRIRLQCRRCRKCRFDPWVRKIPWRRE